jgi:trehalose 6-phosphate phosphatase
VPASAANTLVQALAPLTERRDRTALFCDVDGTLSQIVERAEQAHVPEKTSRLLGALGRRYALVACVSGRSAADARRLVGVGSIAYVGAHGAEVLSPGDSHAEVLPAFASWRDPVRRFATSKDTKELRLLRIRIEDKGPIMAFHWRGAPDEEAARTRLEGTAQEAEAAGLATHWGRKVLEIRPPVPVNKGHALRELVRRSGVRAALFGGDDATDLDGFDALEALVADGTLEAAVRVGVRSEEGPAGIVERADVVVDGVGGFLEVLELLAAD